MWPEIVFLIHICKSQPCRLAIYRCAILNHFHSTHASTIYHLPTVSAIQFLKDLLKPSLCICEFAHHDSCLHWTFFGSRIVTRQLVVFWLHLYGTAPIQHTIACFLICIIMAKLFDFCQNNQFLKIFAYFRYHENWS